MYADGSADSALEAVSLGGRTARNAHAGVTLHPGSIGLALA